MEEKKSVAKNTAAKNRKGNNKLPIIIASIAGVLVLILGIFFWSTFQSVDYAYYRFINAIDDKDPDTAIEYMDTDKIRENRIFRLATESREEFVDDLRVDIENGEFIGLEGSLGFASIFGADDLEKESDNEYYFDVEGDPKEFSESEAGVEYEEAIFRFTFTDEDGDWLITKIDIYLDGESFEEINKELLDQLEKLEDIESLTDEELGGDSEDDIESSALDEEEDEDTSESTIMSEATKPDVAVEKDVDRDDIFFDTPNIIDVSFGESFGKEIEPIEIKVLEVETLDSVTDYMYQDEVTANDKLIRITVSMENVGDETINFGAETIADSRLWYPNGDLYSEVDITGCVELEDVPEGYVENCTFDNIEPGTKNIGYIYFDAPEGDFSEIKLTTYDFGFSGYGYIVDLE